MPSTLYFNADMENLEMRRASIKLGRIKKKKFKKFKAKDLWRVIKKKGNNMGTQLTN